MRTNSNLNASLDEEMEDFCEEECSSEDLTEIDFDYEFDVPKFFDFTRPETDEEIAQADLWLQSAQGYPPLSQQASKSKSKCSSRSVLPWSSRLLKPTASYLAKQNLPFTVRSTRSLGRHQNLESLLISPGEIIATKRQKLEVGFLSKFAYLKRQTTFSHKLANKVSISDVNSSGRPKVTIPKGPDLETAHRAQRHRCKNAAQLGSDSKSDICSTPSSSHENQSYRFKSHSFNYRKEFKLSSTSSKKLAQNPPIELFKKLSLNSEDQPSMTPTLPKKDIRENVQGSTMKENKIPNASTEKQMRCCQKQSQSSGGTAITYTTSNSTGARNH